MADMEYKDGALCVDKFNIGDVDQYVIENEEWLELTIDSSNKIIDGKKSDGTTYISSIESPTLDNINNKIDENFETLSREISDGKSLVCWGDSLTAGAGSGSTTDLAISTKQAVAAKLVEMGFDDWSNRNTNYVQMLQLLMPDYNVINCGVGGEGLDTISAREGGNNALISEQIILPADGSEVSFSGNFLVSSFNRTNGVRPLLQGDGNSVNPCYVQGIECTLRVTFEGFYQNVVYYLKRNNIGDRDVTLPQYTPIIMNGSKKASNQGLAVLWCWQNGGYSSNDELIFKLDNMIKRFKTNKYIIVGLHSGSLSSRNDQEAALEKHFGDKFFNWGQYASTNALYDFGVTVTEDDETAMSSGSMPPSLLTDTVHMNSGGYMILGYKIWERMKNNGYLN